MIYTHIDGVKLFSAPLIGFGSRARLDIDIESM